MEYGNFLHFTSLHQIDVFLSAILPTSCPTSLSSSSSSAFKWTCSTSRATKNIPTTAIEAVNNSSTFKSATRCSSTRFSSTFSRAYCISKKNSPSFPPFLLCQLNQSVSGTVTGSLLSAYWPWGWVLVPCSPVRLGQFGPWLFLDSRHWVFGSSTWVFSFSPEAHHHSHWAPSTHRRWACSWEA